MNKRKIRIQILNLQDEYCKQCEHQNFPFFYCATNCDIGEHIHNLGKNLDVVEPAYVKRTTGEWDVLCQKAIDMKFAGITYPKIAQILGCSKTTLREQLKKRQAYE
ncbi:helix-turn-helix domain-containing protein [Bacillus thuringiensis]|uniref:helix-turn-helix domain-containing protein n=1 Tax=Bacillus thuringiensis TaxID=1428 RepID=UPI00345B2808